MEYTLVKEKIGEMSVPDKESIKTLRKVLSSLVKEPLRKNKKFLKDLYKINLQLSYKNF